MDETSTKRGKRFGAEALAQADELAREIVRAIRKQDLFRVGTWSPTAPESAALVGAGIVGMEDDPDPLAAVLGDLPLPDPTAAPAIATAATARAE